MIVFKQVTKSFGDEDFAVRDLSFEVTPGELVFITGSSGSGKTTLMRLLTKEYSPTEGEIFFENKPLSHIKPSQVHHHRRKIGVVFQDYRLLPELNVWENVALPLFVVGKPQHEVETRVTDLLNLVNLAHKADLFPSQLSGGEAQRISIARALAIGPEIIFADEPTGNLDQETARHIASLLVKINELGTTVLFATHDRRFLEHHPQHRHLHLENGELIVDSKVSTAPNKKAAKKVIDAAAPKHEPLTNQDIPEFLDQDEPGPPKKTATAPEQTNTQPPTQPDEPTEESSSDQPAQPFWKRWFTKQPPRTDVDQKSASETPPNETTPNPAEPDPPPTPKSKKPAKQKKTASVEDL